MHEDDALLGVIYLPLEKVFSRRSQVDGYFPLAGGVGYGRARISLVFRAIQLRAPPEMLGWDCGTLELDSAISLPPGADFPPNLRKMVIKARTTLGKGKFTPGISEKRENGGDGLGGGEGWSSKSGKTVKLAVRKRHSSALVLEFRDSSTAATLSLRDGTPGFCVLWLRDLPDGKHAQLTLPVWRGDAERAARSADPEPGERVGEVKLGVKFWPGLSGYHAKSAGKDKNLQDVMEVLDTVAEDDEVDFDDEAGGGGDSTSSDSSSDEDKEEEKDSLEGDGKRGLTDQVKDYKKHHGQLHRKNRGLMQWKVSHFHCLRTTFPLFGN